MEMAEVPPIFDFDNHYYEAEDAFTRHQDKALRSRGVRWAEIDGRRRLLIGGRVNSYVANPTFDPVAKPGSLFEWYRGNPERKTIVEAFGELEPIRPEYRDRDARLAVMDEQGVAGTMLFPTLGVGVEDALRDDPEAAAKAFEAFNRWLEEDWGFAYQDRIFAVPYVQLLDPSAAADELRSLLERGAVVVDIRNAPVPVPGGYRSPFDPVYDPFWGLAAESGVVVATHAGNDGYDALIQMWEPGGAESSLFRSPLRGVVTKNRAVSDFYATAICHRIFDRFPGSAHGERRERRLVDPRPAAPARRRRQPQPRLLRAAPLGDLRRARVGHAVLGGRRAEPAGRRTGRPPPAGVGLAARRGHPDADGVRHRHARRPRPGGRAADRPRQRQGAAGVAGNVWSWSTSPR